MTFYFCVVEGNKNKNRERERGERTNTQTSSHGGQTDTRAQIHARAEAAGHTLHSARTDDSAPTKVHSHFEL